MTRLKNGFQAYNPIEQLYSFGFIKNLLKIYIDAVMEAVKEGAALDRPAFRYLDECLAD